MKKYLFILVAATMITLPAFSAISDKEAMSERYIINHGHSEEMARLIDLQYSQINGGEPKYVSKEPDYYKEPFVKFVRKMFMYFDPGLDNGKFMQDDIKFTPSSEDI